MTVTARDVADYRYRLSQSQSVLTVRAGERLDELQLLQALLIPSANNIAVILARWDAGSVSKFVAKMNATAQRLGLAHTRYVDPDGSAERTVSTAVDQLTLAQKVMAIPTFARIVSQPAATFPLAGKLFNFDYLIGHRGVVGIKTGSESAAGGCWAFAARRTVDGKPALVFGVVLGQRAKKTGELIQPALDAGLRLIDATPRVVKRVTLVADGTTVGSLSAPWRRSDIALQTKGAISVVAAPGQQYDVKLDLRAPASTSIAAGTVVGRLTVAGAAVPVVVAKDASGPTLKWRLTRL